MTWCVEKLGTFMTLSGDNKVVSRSSDSGWGVQLASTWLTKVHEKTHVAHTTVRCAEPRLPRRRTSQQSLSPATSSRARPSSASSGAISTRPIGTCLSARRSMLSQSMSTRGASHTRARTRALSCGVATHPSLLVPNFPSLRFDARRTDRPATPALPPHVDQHSSHTPRRSVRAGRSRAARG